jgi:hypothetical protein
MQDEVLEEIAMKAKKNGVKVEIMFKSEDPTDRAKVAEQTFTMILRTTF